MTHYPADKNPNRNPAWLDREGLNKFDLMCEWVYLLQALQLICPYLLNCGERMDGNSTAVMKFDRMLLFF